MSTTEATSAPSTAQNHATDQQHDPIIKSRKFDVHHALKGPHTPKAGNVESVAQRFEDLVERTRGKHEAHVGVSDVAGISEAGGAGDASKLDKLSGYFKRLGCNVLPSSEDLNEDFVSWKMGNYVALRDADGKTEQKLFETMPMYVRVGMHLLFYSSKKHSLLRWNSIEALLKRMSEREGEIYDDDSKPEDVQEFIRNFIKTYAIDTKDLVEQDMTKYKTRNEFFYRKMKMDVRPLAEAGNDKVISSAADCRLTVFDSATKAKDIWIKGRKFSVHELLDPRGDWSSGVRGENVSSLLSDDSTIAIFRLAPADYHRFHHPVGPVTVLDHQRGGQEYYTVNPDAVNENFDVFTGNVRDVCLLKWNTFTVGFAAIGALLVGSIRYTNADSGSAYQRGGEMGYFAYGGSTVIAVFPAEAKVKWDDDLRANSLKGLETLIKVNERIGVSEA